MLEKLKELELRNEKMLEQLLDLELEIKKARQAGKKMQVIKKRYKEITGDEL